MDAHRVLVPIASLTPPEDASEDSRQIRAIVSLVWPFSSSQSSLAFLLAEPDIRLRTNHGQVTVRFRDEVARDAARSQVDIGDELVLDLAGATWVENVEETRTPGRSVRWALQYNHTLRMKVLRSGRVAEALDIDGSHPAREGRLQVTPNADDRPRNDLRPTQSQDMGEGMLRSPAFYKRHRSTTGSFVDSAFNPSFDEREHTRKKRKSWMDVREWKLSDRSPSPDDVKVAVDEDESVSEARLPVDAAAGDGRLSNDMDQSIIQMDVKLDTFEEREALQMDNDSQSEVSSRETAEMTFDAEPYKIKGETESDERFSEASIPGTDSDDAHYYTDEGAASDDEGGVTGSDHAESSRSEPSGVIHEESPSPDVGEMSSEDSASPVSHVESPDATSEAAESSRAIVILSDSEEDEKEDHPDDYTPQVARDGFHFQSNYLSTDTPTPMEGQPLISSHVERWGMFYSSSFDPEPARGPPSGYINDDPSMAYTLESRLCLEGQESEHEEPSRNRNAIPVSNLGVSFPFGMDGTAGFAVQDSSGIGGANLEAQSTDVSSVGQSLFSLAADAAAQRAPKSSTDQAEPQPGKIWDTVRSETRNEALDHLTSVSRMILKSDPVDSFEGQTPERGFGTVPQTPDASQPQLTQMWQHPPANALLTPMLTRANPQSVAHGAGESPVHSPSASASRPENWFHQIPDVLSPWFTPSRASRAGASFQSSGNELTATEDHSPSVDRETPHAAVDPVPFDMTSTPDVGASQEKRSFTGIRTSLSYYCPLPNLVSYVNLPMPTSCSVIGLVVRPATRPARSKSGPRDFSTVLSISSPELWPAMCQVQVFRPWRHALPCAAKGDVILLGEMRAQMHKGAAGLVSANNSAWCVWRYDLSGAEREGLDAHQDPRVQAQEEMTGPPLEIGEEERAAVSEMRQWYLGVLEEQLKGQFEEESSQRETMADPVETERREDSLSSPVVVANVAA